MKLQYNHTYKNIKPEYGGLTLRVDDIGVVGKCRMVCVNPGSSDDWARLESQIQEFNEDRGLSEEYWKDISFDVYLKQAELC